jgi:membrane protein YqaA with SNARE-associated domain
MINLIPFVGPSNMLIAAAYTASGLGNGDFTTFLIVGFLVALGATVAKGLHYGTTFFISQHLNEKRRATLEINATKVKKWAFMLLFLVAATPIPDEPIVFTLGLTKYSLSKFFTAFFLGKFSICVMGAFAGGKIGEAFSAWLSPLMIAVISTILTIGITIILFKVDLNKITGHLIWKKSTQDGK